MGSPYNHSADNAHTSLVAKLCAWGCAYQGILIHILHKLAMLRSTCKTLPMVDGVWLIIYCSFIVDGWLCSYAVLSVYKTVKLTNNLQNGASTQGEPSSVPLAASLASHTLRIFRKVKTRKRTRLGLPGFYPLFFATLPLCALLSKRSSSNVVTDTM